MTEQQPYIHPDYEPSWATLLTPWHFDYSNPLTKRAEPRENEGMDENSTPEEWYDGPTENLCADCSSDGTPDYYADVTQCENCGEPIEPAARIHAYTSRGF